MTPRGTLRSDAYRIAVRELPCMLNVAGVQCPTGPSVLVHNDMQSLGKGMGHKSVDIGSAGCPGCHHEIGPGKRLSREDRQYYTLRGTVRTVAALIENGTLTIIRRK